MLTWSPLGRGFLTGCIRRGAAALAVAFPLAHPAVTSVILGPRTLPQLEDLLAGFSLELDDPALDRIDEIVPPGTDLADLTWKPPALTDPALRRRLTGQRAAGGGRAGHDRTRSCYRTKRRVRG